MLDRWQNKFHHCVKIIAVKFVVVEMKALTLQLKPQLRLQLKPQLMHQQTRQPTRQPKHLLMHQLNQKPKLQAHANKFHHELSAVIPFSTVILHSYLIGKLACHALAQLLSIVEVHSSLKVGCSQQLIAK